VLTLDVPKIIDADALNLIAQSGEKYELGKCIITPHPKEAARLLQCDDEWIMKNRNEAALKLRDKFHTTAILKGHGTLIVGKSGEVYFCDYGNPGMATAGMGDVLAGIIGGAVASGLELEKAAIFGAIVHAAAGDVVAKKYGEVGMLPTDLIAEIQSTINSG
jgi:NAD(P)H-hydrate epimerase